MHLARRLRYWAETRREEVFLVCGADRLTWEAFDRKARQLAAHFITIGVEPGDRVGCLLDNSTEWCIAFAASIYADAIFVPLNIMFGPPELQEIQADSECRAIVSTPTLMARLKVTGAASDAITVFDMADGAKRTLASVFDGPHAIPYLHYDANAVLTICYTSGTTGVPKGVVHTHASANCMVSSLIAGYGWVSGQERILITAPLTFAGGYICALTPAIILGSRAYVMKAHDPQAVLDLFVREKITTYGGVPTLWQRVSETPGFAEADLSNLRVAFTGGAPANDPLLRKFHHKGVVIQQAYGCTECCGGATIVDKATALERPSACGKAMMGLELQVETETGEVARQGEVGEICLRGEQMMREYWRKPEATAQAHRDGWFHTGDLGYIDEHGDLVVIDRKKSMIITGGVNVYPAQVERTLLTSLPQVKEVVVLGMPSETWGEEVVAIVHGETWFDLAALTIEARALLGSYKAPKRIVQSAEPLPKTTTGKIARAGLQDLFASLQNAR